MNGYTHCACETCFEIAIGKFGKALCWECREHGCERYNGECNVPIDCYDDDDDGGGFDMKLSVA
jgi:hypothetical protein